MKKMKMAKAKAIAIAGAMAIVMGAVGSVLSACGQTEEPEVAQTKAADGAMEVADGTDKDRATQNDETADLASRNPMESKDEGRSVTSKADVLESLTGEYEYLSDYGTGRLTIGRTSSGYDISDYESEASCRFLADSSNVEAVEDNRIYIKYPEQVFSDGEAVFGYYILEYSAGGIDVYYGKAAFDEAAFLYHATKKTEAGDVDDSASRQENGTQAFWETDSKVTAEELLDLFIDGKTGAADPADATSVFYITDLNMDSDEWDSYSVGEKIDLDNDGENELIICGPYGGIYLDARDGKVYKFAGGDGTADVLSYTYYNGAVWIMYSSRSSAGFDYYHMEKFEGADNLTAEMNFGEEFTAPDNADPELKYTLNGNEISHDEYTELRSKILAAEVNTN